MICVIYMYIHNNVYICIHKLTYLTNCGACQVHSLRINFRAPQLRVISDSWEGTVSQRTCDGGITAILAIY